MDERAKKVADRWSRNREKSREEKRGFTDEKFDKELLKHLRWCGWSDDDAQSIIKNSYQYQKKGKRK